jgi:hypothetical protein
MGDSFDLEMAAASLRADGADVGVLMKALVKLLADALGSQMQVQRSGGRFKKSDEIRSLRIVMNSDEFSAELDGTVLDCTVGHSSGGIRIRREKVDVDAWLARLLSALKSEAAHSQTVRQALEHIVIGGST